jgi:hypothetical protein
VGTVDWAGWAAEATGKAPLGASPSGRPSLTADRIARISVGDWRLVLEPVIAPHRERGLCFRRCARLAKPESYELPEADQVLQRRVGDLELAALPAGQNNAGEVSAYTDGPRWTNPSLPA